VGIYTYTHTHTHTYTQVFKFEIPDFTFYTTKEEWLWICWGVCVCWALFISSLRFF